MTNPSQEVLLVDPDPVSKRAVRQVKLNYK